MKVKLYVNWDDGEILNEKQMESRLRGRASNIFKDEDEFSEWLHDEYTISDIFNMNEEEKDQVRQKWGEACLESAQDELISGYDAKYELVEKEI